MHASTKEKVRFFRQRFNPELCAVKACSLVAAVRVLARKVPVICTGYNKIFDIISNPYSFKKY
jgi:hypothetical protein